MKISITASKRVCGTDTNICDLDYDVVFIDNGAGFVAPGDTVTLADVKEYWNNNLGYDGILTDEYHGDYDAWMSDMLEDGYLKEI